MRCREGSYCITAIVVATLCQFPRSSSALAIQGPPFGTTFDAHVARTMRHWDAPGVLVVVVKDGQLALARGYGTRVFGDQRPIGDTTLVHIASHSKAFTATALAMVVDAGMLSWDDPIKKYISEFELADPYVADHITVRDLLAHRAGLPGVIGGFNDAAFGAPSLLAALRTRSPNPAFREQQSYSNVGYALAGEVLSRATGISWEQFIHERVFAPLQMRDSYTSNADLSRRFGDPSAERDIFLPASKRDGVVEHGDWADIGTQSLYAPAGGIITTGRDIAKWMTFLLQDGEYNGVRLLSSNVLYQTRTPQVLLDPLLRFLTDPLSQLAAGALGWIVVPYEGRRLYQAPGGWMSSIVTLVPSDMLGVAIFTNAYFAERHPFESVFLVAALTMHTIDVALDIGERDWSIVFEQALSQ